MICLDEGDLDQALSLAQEALSLRQQQLPSGHPDVAQALLGVAEVLMAQEQYEEAEHRLTAAVQVCREVQPKGCFPLGISSIVGLHIQGHLER